MQERFTALADILSSGSYDVVVLQEVWLEQYYNIIKDAMPYVSPFRCIYILKVLNNFRNESVIVLIY